LVDLDFRRERSETKSVSEGEMQREKGGKKKEAAKTERKTTGARIRMIWGRE
jgi:hypothetical protein